MTTKNHALGATIGITVLLTATACGVGRPDIDDLTSALKKQDSIVPVTADRAECFAQVLHDSDLSDETLTAIAENDSDYSASSDEQNTLTRAIAQAQTACT